MLLSRMPSVKPARLALYLPLLLALALAPPIFAQEKKLDRIRIGGGSGSATQMAMWLAREAGLYEENGVAAQGISIPGRSLALPAMLAGEGARHQRRGPGRGFARISLGGTGS